jgi:hypothetical protein
VGQPVTVLQPAVAGAALTPGERGAVTPCEGQGGQRWSLRGRGGQQRAYRNVVRDVALNSSAAGEVGGGRAAADVRGGLAASSKEEDGGGKSSRGVTTN